MHILQKIFTYTKCHILNFTTFTSHLILYNHNTSSRTEDPGKVFGLQHLHLKIYFKKENCEPTGLVSTISSKCCYLLFVPPNMKVCTEMVVKLFMRKLSFC